MSKWKRVKLGDFIVQIRGVSYKPQDTSDTKKEGYIAILRAHNIQDEGLNLENLIYVNRSKVTDQQFIKTGDIVVCASSGSKNLVGKAAQAKNDMNISFGAFCKVIRTSKLFAPYLGSFFRSKYYRRMISDSSSGANINNIRNEDIECLLIPIPPLETQKQIAKSLDTVSELLSMRKQQLAELDNLIKSVFYDMFGDPMINEKGWKREKFNSVILGSPKNGFFAKNYAYCREGNAEVIWISDFIDRIYCDLSNLKRVKASSKEIQKYKVSYGDLLFCRSSLTKAGIGKCSIIPQEVCENTLFECHIIKVKIDISKLEPVFMQVQTTTDFFRNQIETNSKTSTMTTISQEGITENIIILPPMNLQVQFAKKVRMIEAQKSLVKKAIEETQLLFDSLMSQYFD